VHKEIALQNALTLLCSIQPDFLNYQIPFLPMLFLKKFSDKNGKFYNRLKFREQLPPLRRRHWCHVWLTSLMSQKSHIASSGYWNWLIL